VRVPADLVCYRRHLQKKLSLPWQLVVLVTRLFCLLGEKFELCEKSGVNAGLETLLTCAKLGGDLLCFIKGGRSVLPKLSALLISDCKRDHVR
jgi:hypothetical protein